MSEIQAAAARLLHELEIHVQHYGCVDGEEGTYNNDLKIVARFALDNAAEREVRESEVANLRGALQTIRDNYGRVCVEYELCHHIACESSVGAWMEADAALSAASQGPAAGETIEKQSRCSVLFNSERVQGQCPYATLPGNDMCGVHDSQRIVPLDSAGE
jgi:hypothetical protein